MKKTVLLALNARYFHTNLAVRCLKGYAGEDYDVEIVERTINDDMDSVLEEVVSRRPDVVGFSCYIWNIEHILQLEANLKKVLPGCFIFMGGPEAGFEYMNFLEANPFVDMMIKGEGEITFLEWLKAFEAGEGFYEIAGTAVRHGDEIIDNAVRYELLDLNSLPFLYNDLSEYENKIIYFETSRGCPMNCSYCMSGLGKSMSYMDFTRVEYAFEHFLKNNVRQVKLVDRTFNYPLERAKKIISMLIGLKGKYTAAQTNFHFEITASIMDGEFIGILKKAPEGLIQLEAGVQSTNPETLKAIYRSIENEKLLANIKKIAALGNITVYADLIAGLPHESYESFGRSFNDVYSLGTEKIHLGFLKVLKGSAIREDARKYGIVYSDSAPYKVLKTNDISYDELRELERVEHVLELYKNSGNFETSLEYAAGAFEAPFGFYESFAVYAKSTGFFNSRQSIAGQYDTLYDFMAQSGKGKTAELKDNLLFDWAMMEKPRRYPKCIEPEDMEKERAFARAFFNDPENIEKYLPGYIKFTPSAVSRMCHIAHLSASGLAVLYDYKKDKKERACFIS